MKIGIIGWGMNSHYHINFTKAHHGIGKVGLVDNAEYQKNVECY
jgi:hypothetical protein